MLKKFASENREIVALQQNIQQELDSITSAPFLSGSIVTGVELAVGNNQISHKLGRNIIGYQIVRQNASATFYEISSDDKTITLNSSAAVTISLRVF